MRIRSPLEDKIRKIAKEIYGALGVTIAPAAKKELANITEMGKLLDKCGNDRDNNQRWA